MKNFPKQKDEDQEYEDQEQDNNEGNASKDGGDITQLTGSPEPGGVSKVAMGEKANTLFEHDEIMNGEWIKRLKGEDSTEHSDLCSIEDSYAKLFEGLAGIMRAKS